MNANITDKKQLIHRELYEISSKCQSFHVKDEPEIIHIIKTGFVNRYMIVFEDAYELILGKIEFGNKQEIENRFNIKLREI
jgi:hypothetical protein